MRSLENTMHEDAHRIMLLDLSCPVAYGVGMGVVYVKLNLRELTSSWWTIQIVKGVPSLGVDNNILRISRRCNGESKSVRKRALDFNPSPGRRKGNSSGPISLKFKLFSKFFDIVTIQPSTRLLLLRRQLSYIILFKTLFKRIQFAFAER